MATPAVTPQAPTAWDENGNPAQPQQPAATGVTAWDEQGNPVSQPPKQDAGFLPTVGKDVVEGAKGLLQFAKDFVEHGTNEYDPENPIAKGLAQQWNSSVQAKNRMQESFKKGDTLGVV